MELPFLLGADEAWSDAPMLGCPRTIDESLARRMRSVWAGFAREGIGSLPTRTMRFV